MSEAIICGLSWTISSGLPGFSPRYGLCYTNYETGERIPKKSAGWYSGVISENGFD